MARTKHYGGTISDTSTPPADVVLTPTSSLREMGVAGIKITSGYVHDEYLPQLSGAQGQRVYREMKETDATVASILYAIEMTLRSVEWTVVCDDDSPEAESAIEFLESVLEDMSHTWDDFISSIMSMLPFGWQFTEIVYKRRKGPFEKDPSYRSKYTDGKIGIRKLADRSQETLDHWRIDDRGNVQGMWQTPPNGGTPLFIPLGKSMIFRPSSYKGSPEGRSILRGAYRSWYFLKNIQEIEAISIERELAGLPVVYIPNEILNGTSAEAIAARASYENLVRNIKNDEQGGVVLPSNTYLDHEGKPTNIKQVELTLLSSSGQRAIEPGKTITRYQQDIARVILADFLLLGTNTQQRAGSQALGDTKTELFNTSMQGLLDSIAETFNRQAVPRLWQLNGMDSAVMARVQPGLVSKENLAMLGDFVSKLASAGADLFPDEELENELRAKASLPEKNMDEMRYKEPPEVIVRPKLNRTDEKTNEPVQIEGE